MHKPTEPSPSPSSVEETAEPPVETTELGFAGIPHTEIPRAWRYVQTGVVELCEQSDGTFEARDVFKALLDKDMQLWILHQGEEYVGFIITQIIDYPQARACSIFMVHGKDRKKWLHFEAELDEWAKAQGCKIMESYARKGWLKVMGEEWKVSSTLVRKEL